MQPIDKSTFQQETASVKTIVGDEKQKKFYPRIKVQKWNNEANFSIGLADADGTYNNKNGVVTYTKGDISARFYEITGEKPPVSAIRRVLAGDELKALQATSEYELFNQIGEPGTLNIAHYVVTEPSLSLFDLSPASVHLKVDEKGQATDFNYADKSKYHPNDIPIPKYETLPVVRFYTPYNLYVNPYYMDAGLHNIDIQWHGSELKHATEKLAKAVEAVAAKHGIEAKRDKNNAAKICFKHNGKWVKFFSCQEEDGGLYAYININCSYNKAYDFYRPDVAKDIRNEYAYGLKHAYPDVDNSIVDEIMRQFADNIGVQLTDQPYTEDEKTKWETIQKLQDNLAWNIEAKRDDANYVHVLPEDGFEFDITYATKPTSNKVKLTTNNPKNVVAYFQAEIDFTQQIKEQSQRRPHIYNSLAIYHNEKKNNEYQTGKIAHIHRPIASDANGYRVFCDFEELTGLKDGEIYDLSKGLTIVVPQGFLDNGAYPIIVDPTFGYGTAGATTSAITNTIQGTLVSPTADGRVSSVFVYQNTAGATSLNLEMALYDNLGSFNYLTQTSNLTTATATGWIGRATTSLVSVTNGTNYILAGWGTATLGQGGAANMYYDSTGGKTSYSLTSTYAADTWPTTLAGASTQSSRQYSIYAVYGYQFPIMVGSSATIAAAARNIPLATTNDVGWTSSNVTADTVVPAAGGDITRLKITQTTAPGASTSRTYNPQTNDSANTGLSVTIADSATSGSDTTGVVLLGAGDLLQFGYSVSGSPATSVGSRWRLTQTNTSQPLYTTPNATVSISANRFIGVQDTGGAATTAAAATQYAAEGGILKNLYAKMNTALTSGSYLVEVYKGGVATGMKVTLDNANQSATDAANTVTVAAGNTVYIQITPTSPNAAKTIAFGMEYAATTSGNGVLMGSNNTNTSNSSTVYNNWYGSGAWDATESNVQALAEDIYITAIYVALSAAPGGSGPSRTITLRVNGANTAASVAITGASTTGTWSGVVPIKQDDLICIAQVPASTPAASTVKYTIVYTTVPPTLRSGNYSTMRLG